MGWDRPFLVLLVGWLWARREEMPGMLVVVPTAQAGRRLREALAEQGGGLTPRIVTPGHFLQTPGAAPQAIEHLAWVETFEGITDWSVYADAFPVPPGEGEAAGWALGLAGAMTQLRASLQENALTLAGAAKRLSETVEADRWKVLAALEEKVEGLLAEWGHVSRSAILARRGVEWVNGASRLVLAGVADFPGATAWLIERSRIPVTALIGAPENEEEHFDPLGRPRTYEEGKKEAHSYWNERPLEWPVNGSVTLTADPRQQAAEAVRLAADAGTPSDDLVLGSADEETAAELVHAFGRAGWVLHDPSRRPAQPVMAWLAAWREFVDRPTTAAAFDLLGFPQTEALTGEGRARRAVAVSNSRDQWLARDLEGLDLAAGLAGRPDQKLDLEISIGTLRVLGGDRDEFQKAGFHQGLTRLLETIDPSGMETAAAREWLAATASLARRVDRSPAFWMDLLLATRPEGSAVPPEERVLDVQGWLELFHEPGDHLIVCGMNEGKVPGRASTDAWLPEGARGMLGLSTDATRAARDAYLLAAMLEARRDGGRVDLLLAKAGAGGDALLPSRLLLAASVEDLPGRVAELFRGLEPPDAALAFTLDEAWKWRPRVVAWEPRMNVTSFQDYLACPFRFYLKHVLRMSEPEPDRVEWNARDFGNIAHIVLERWAKDDAAANLPGAEDIAAWVHVALDEEVRKRFGAKPPLAVRIQTEALRQRLSWFARVQAEEYARGWRIDEIEKKFELVLDGIKIVGRVDRTEKNIDGRRRVLDYKTGFVPEVEKSHRVGITASTRLPEHLQNVPQILSTAADGKTKRWKNLQLALYCAALEEIDEVGYFCLGSTEADVRLSLWDGFDAQDLESAVACANWVVRQARDGVFWPPAEKVDYDDYELLSLGRGLAETVEFAGGVA